MKQIKALAISNNGPESERIRLDRMSKGSVGEESAEEQLSPPSLPPAKRARIEEEERENSGQEDDVIVVEEPQAKRPRIVGGEEHLDISVHRGGRRVVEVDL
jgi:hypothetical protein